jgi:hypothetical protein
MRPRGIGLFTLMVLVLWIGGCAAAPSDAQRGSLALVKMWPAPPSAPPEYRYREDREGPFPASWPTLAFVARTRAQADYDDSWGDATLFLVSGPHLTAADDLLSLVASARFVDRCHLFPPADIGPARPCYGAWVQMAKRGAEELFVLVDCSGGTSYRRVRAYQHIIEFRPVYQCHWFDRVLEDDSRVPVYVGDQDGDGAEELLIGSEETNASGAAETPQVYRVMKWSNDHRRMEEVGEVDASDVYGNPKFDLLCP